MGSKSKNLAVLSASGIRVPKGFSLPNRFFQEMLAALMTNFQSVPTAVELRDAIMEYKFTDELLEFIRFKLATIPDTSLFAVRSSGIVYSESAVIEEDSLETSLAGQFDSYLKVHTDKLALAIKKCWASFLNERSISRFKYDEDYVKQSMMTVVIQEMISARSSAVLMTCVPDDEAKGAMEFCWGACGALVDGSIIPDEIEFCRAKGLILKTNIGEKDFQLSYSEFDGEGQNKVKTPNSDHCRNSFSLSYNEITRIIEIAHKIEQIFSGVPQDIELVVSESGEIVIVQSRPVTCLSDDFPNFNLAA